MIKVDAELNAGGFLSELKGMDAGVLGLVQRFESFTSLLPGIAALAGAFAAFNSTLEKGAHLEALSKNTGQSIQDLVVLQQAFKNANIDAGTLGKTLTKFQANLGEAASKGGPAAEALEKLGLSAKNLSNQSALTQFQALQAGLEGVTDQAERASILKDLFGKGGAKMNALLGDPEAIAKSKEQLGLLPEVMAKMAPIFEMVSNSIGAIGLKIQQFLAGALESVGPVLQDIFGEINKLDLTGLGEFFGLAISLALKLLYVLQPILEIINAISGGFHRGLSNALPAVPEGKKKNNGDLEDKEKDVLGDKSPVSHLASIGGSFGGGSFGVDLGSRVDRTNQILERIAGAVSKDTPAAPHQREKVPV